jgi:hypothetical protein
MGAQRPKKKKGRNDEARSWLLLAVATLQVVDALTGLILHLL